MYYPTIYAVTGPPGSGKTTLCHQLLDLFAGARYISMDSYQQMTDWDMAQLQQWVSAGADYNLLPMPGLMQALADLKASVSQVANSTSSRIILFESHIGSSTRLLSSLVDYVIWIDCDYDIALARAMLSAFSQGMLFDLEYYLNTYIAFSSDLLRLQRQRIRPNASYLYDGDQERLVRWINYVQSKLT